MIVFSMIVGLALDFIDLDPIRGLYYAAIVNGIAAPPLIILMVLLARSRRMGAFRSGVLSVSLCVIAIGVSTALPLAWLLS